MQIVKPEPVTYTLELTEHEAEVLRAMALCVNWFDETPEHKPFADVGHALYRTLRNVGGPLGHTGNAVANNGFVMYKDWELVTKP